MPSISINLHNHMWNISVVTAFRLISHICIGFVHCELLNLHASQLYLTFSQLNSYIYRYNLSPTVAFLIGFTSWLKDSSIGFHFGCDFALLAFLRDVRTLKRHKLIN